ncbi:hypothetical protein GQ464_017840 [Rhodocaloribacter litoris]|uniref:PilN domain-containing protein n=1 Tax=Rhodocaloribacter litoris TaxID=2558931 RepID=UPI0014220E46|nr:hypothetical protein [Rhodocaloribacter litoris]QXD15236.1 hypothetical protein GQ464_017840 [Rhodocaloribacter litoris]
MKKYGTKQYVLGVAANSKTVDAVLLREGPEGPVVVRTFRRHRNATYMTADLADTPAAVQETGSGDFTIQFGEGGGASDLFLASEFEGLEAGGQGGEGLPGAESAVSTFELELADILAACEDAGYTDLQVAFCNGSLDVTAVELRIQHRKEEKKEEAAKKGTTSGEEAAPARPGKAPDRGALLERLAAQQGEKYEPDQVAFLPMTPAEGGVPRYLALIRPREDAVVATVQALREERKNLPPVRLLDTEVHAYLGIARAVQFQDAGPEDVAPDPLMGRRRTLIVRAGAEDTLVMFVEEGTLQHCESLRSITTFDAPETICSRVMLLQDEYATGEVQHVLVLGEDREALLVESFSLFFPDARVEPLWHYLPRPEDEDAPEASPAAAGHGEAVERSRVLATAAALRLVPDEVFGSVFEAVNLLPARLMRRQFTMPVPWPALVMLAVLFCTVLFFVYRYFDNERAVAEVTQRLQVRQAAEVEEDARALQARIDSMKATTAGYIRALDVLDSLLVGSDQWSRALEKMARETAAISGGIWVESWRLSGNELELQGNATERHQVVRLADRLNASIRSLSFSEIREWPVYSFRMTFPLDRDLPEAARYLREHARIELPSEETAAPARPAGQGPGATRPTRTPAPASSPTP